MRRPWRRFGHVPRRGPPPPRSRSRRRSPPGRGSTPRRPFRPGRRARESAPRPTARRPPPRSCAGRRHAAAPPRSRTPSRRCPDRPRPAGAVRGLGTVEDEPDAEERESRRCGVLHDRPPRTARRPDPRGQPRVVDEGHRIVDSGILEPEERGGRRPEPGPDSGHATARRALADEAHRRRLGVEGLRRRDGDPGGEVGGAREDDGGHEHRDAGCRGEPAAEHDRRATPARPASSIPSARGRRAVGMVTARRARRESGRRLRRAAHRRPSRRTTAVEPSPARSAAATTHQRLSRSRIE